MKKNRTIFLLCTLAMAACSKETLLTPEGNGIGFNILITRGAGINNAKGVADAGGFDVWGYSHVSSWASVPVKTTLFSGNTVTSDNAGVTWDYGTPVMWPDGEAVSFFAFAPAGSAGSVAYDVEEVPVITFAVNNVPANQVDLLIAGNMFNKMGPDPVSVAFDHALSQIKFSALKANITEEVKITNITLKNLYFTGSVSLLTPVVWSVDISGGVRDYTLSTASGLQNVALTTATQELNTSNGALFLMPQVVQGAAEMAVTFTVEGQPLHFTSPLTSPAKWLPGRSYNYQLFIDGDAVQVIVIDSDLSLDPWQTGRVLQTLLLGANQAKNLQAIYRAVTAFNTLKANGKDCGATEFIVYATGNVIHNLDIDLDFAATLDFVKDDVLVFDFTSHIDVWDSGVEVSVVNSLTASGWDFVTSDLLQGKGKIIMVKK